MKRKADMSSRGPGSKQSTFCKCKAIFLLQASKEGTVDSPWLPTGGFLISASAVPHCGDNNNNNNNNNNRGDGMAELVERRTRIKRTKVRIPLGAQE